MGTYYMKTALISFGNSATKKLKNLTKYIDDMEYYVINSSRSESISSLFPVENYYILNRDMTLEPYEMDFNSIFAKNQNNDSVHYWWDKILKKYEKVIVFFSYTSQLSFDFLKQFLQLVTLAEQHTSTLPFRVGIIMYFPSFHLDFGKEIPDFSFDSRGICYNYLLHLSTETSAYLPESNDTFEDLFENKVLREVFSQKLYENPAYIEELNREFQQLITKRTSL